MPSMIINGTLILGNESEFFTQVGGSTGVTDVLGMYTQTDMTLTHLSLGSEEGSESDVD